MDVSNFTDVFFVFSVFFHAYINITAPLLKKILQKSYRNIWIVCCKALLLHPHSRENGALT